MDNYIKTIINCLKSWVTNGLNRVESSVSKLSGNLNTLGSRITSLASNVWEHSIQINELYNYENDTYGIATNAQTAADNAQSAATKAQTTADNAQSAATKAQTTADNAQSAATNAQTTADNAQSTANEAKSAASTKLDKNNGVATNSLSIRKEGSGSGSGSDFARVDLTPVGIQNDYKLRLKLSGGWQCGPNISGDGPAVILKNIDAPEEDTDAANKSYVDEAVADTISEDRANELIDEKLGVIENGSY